MKRKIASLVLFTWWSRDDVWKISYRRITVSKTVSTFKNWKYFDCMRSCLGMLLAPWQRWWLDWDVAVVVEDVGDGIYAVIHGLMWKFEVGGGLWGMCWGRSIQRVERVGLGQGYGVVVRLETTWLMNWVLVLVGTCNELQSAPKVGYVYCARSSVMCSW